VSRAFAALRRAVSTCAVGTALLSLASTVRADGGEPPRADPPSQPDTASADDGEPKAGVPAEAATPPTSAPAASAPEPSAATPHEPPVESPPSALELSPAVAIDTVLACGLRLIAVEDQSLPVAAIVLAVEVGSVDDPPELPGLVHALAYHLLEGNRELSPGASIRILHDAGGWVSLATSTGQTRYEALVPLPSLDEALRIEALRLRAPTVSRERWENALAWASRDHDTPSTIPLEALAAVHRQAALAHDPRAVPPALLTLSPSAIGQHLAQRFRYERATLVVVAPQSPLATLATVQARFADLPPRSRPNLAARTEASAGAGKVGGTQREGTAFAWPIQGTPAARLEARVWCRTLNRQRPGPTDPKRAKVHCTLDPDPRHPTLVVAIDGSDAPLALLDARLARLASGGDLQLLERQREIVRVETEMTLAQPLPLARQLAMAPPREQPDDSVLRPIDELTGLLRLRDPKVDLSAMTRAFDPRRAVELVPTVPSKETAASP